MTQSLRLGERIIMMGTVETEIMWRRGGMIKSMKEHGAGGENGDYLTGDDGPGEHGGEERDGVGVDRDEREAWGGDDNNGDSLDRDDELGVHGGEEHDGTARGVGQGIAEHTGHGDEGDIGARSTMATSRTGGSPYPLKGISSIVLCKPSGQPSKFINRIKINNLGTISPGRVKRKVKALEEEPSSRRETNSSHLPLSDSSLRVRKSTMTTLGVGVGEGGMRQSQEQGQGVTSQGNEKVAGSKRVVTGGQGGPPGVQLGAGGQGDEQDGQQLSTIGQRGPPWATLNTDGQQGPQLENLKKCWSSSNNTFQQQYSSARQQITHHPERKEESNIIDEEIRKNKEEAEDIKKFGSRNIEEETSKFNFTSKLENCTYQAEDIKSRLRTGQVLPGSPAFASSRSISARNSSTSLGVSHNRPDALSRGRGRSLSPIFYKFYGGTNCA